MCSYTVFPLLNDTCETFGSTSSMLDHGLQQLLHALTHDTMSCDSPSVKTTTAEYHCPLWYFTSSFFLTYPHFPRTAHRHRTSIQIRAAYSITARSASLRRPLSRCSVDLLHLDQFSWTLSNVGGAPRPFHASNYLGLTQVLNLEKSSYLSSLPRSQPLVVVAAAHFLLTIIGILATRSPLVASIGTPPFNVNPFTCRGRL